MKIALMVWAELETVCFHEYRLCRLFTWTVSDDFAHETIMVTFVDFGPNTSRMAAIATLAHTFLYWHVKKKILFRYGELIRLSPGGGGRCGRERGMGGQDGLRAGADAR